MARPVDKKQEDGFEIALLIGAVGLVIGALLWFFARRFIVVLFAPLFYKVAKVWYLIPFVDTNAILIDMHQKGAELVSDPRHASFGLWFDYVSTAFRPISWIIVLLCALLVWRVAMKAKPNFRRKMKPEQLAEYLSHIFTGTAPILHLRKALVKNKDPLWARQTFPHEVLLNERVNGKPIVVDNSMSKERARAYFMGLKTTRDPKSSKLVPVTEAGRWTSKMLGRQVVNLTADAGKKGIVFADRFSNTGKVIFALLCAHAFGGEEGKADYGIYKDKLNNSCRGVRHGFANLTVAQPLFDKYRTNKAALSLFQVHHWEYTYLFALLIAAKKKGKCGHWEWLWLKPMNRILFYVLNTLGRFTPHTESAAAFAQFAYERKVSRRKRLPLMASPDGAGLVHVIYVEKAVKGLQLAWDRWVEGDDSQEEEWWNNRDIWQEASNVFAQLAKPPAPPSEMVKDTAFDKAMRSDENAAAGQRTKDVRDAIKAQQGEDAFDFNF
jgi:hypothetical protein